MAIITNLDVMMARRKTKLKDLAARIGISETNLSLLKNGKVRGIRYQTLNAICDELDCQPGDILEYRPEGDAESDA
ncbi:MAG: helix-turn-helix transcriptional regulator [Pseudomonadota bacterium]